MDFIEKLWQSIFTPGTTPTLVLATHATFALLITSLSTLVFMSRGNLHLLALLSIALILWGLLAWFIGELQAIQEENNDSCNKGINKSEEERSAKQEKKVVKDTTTYTSKSIRKRKV